MEDTTYMNARSVVLVVQYLGTIYHEANREVKHKRVKGSQPLVALLGYIFRWFVIFVHIM